MKTYRVIIVVDEETVKREMYEQDTERAIINSFGCLEDSGINLDKLEEVDELVNKG